MTRPITIRLLLLAADPAHVSTCLHVAVDGTVVARTRCDTAHPLPPAPDTRDVLVVPSEALRLQWLDLPAHTQAQALAAARLMLQDHVAGSSEHLHVALAVPADGNARRLLAVVDDTSMREWLQRASALGLEATSVVPDCLLLDAPMDDGVQALERNGLWLVRGQELAFAAEPDLARRIIGERPLHWLDAGAVEMCMAGNARSTATLDLLQGAYAPRPATAPGRHRRLSWLLALVLLSPVLFIGAEAIHHALAARWLEHRTDALAAAYQSQLDGDALPALYRQRIAPDLLAVHSTKLFEALRSVPGTQLDSYEFTPDTGVRAGLLHGTEQDLDLLRRQLADSGLDLAPLGSQPIESGLRSLVAVEPLQ